VEDVDRANDGRLFIAMEYAAGDSYSAVPVMQFGVGVGEVHHG
jgi:hypothetical protein